MLGRNIGIFRQPSGGRLPAGPPFSHDPLRFPSAETPSPVQNPSRGILRGFDFRLGAFANNTQQLLRCVLRDHLRISRRPADPLA